jgi:hypothetical protein
MCAQCMATAATAAAGATGLRAWLATRHYSWVTPRRLRVASGALLTAAGVIAAAGLG